MYIRQVTVTYWFCFTLIALGGCASQDESTQASERSISFEHSAGHDGKEQSFAVTFFESGVVLYEGRANVSKPGRYRKTIGIGGFEVLWDRITQKGFWELADEYHIIQTTLPNGDILTKTRSGLPYRYLTLRDHNRTKSISYKYGEPPLLKEAEQAIMTIVSSIVSPTKKK
jgi:hypothetical protein